MAKLHMLLILDGWGVRKEKEGNAIALARIPNYRKLLEKYPHSILYASEEPVGLPKGQIGGSEVGHLNIGAGRIVFNELVRISQAIEDKSFFRNKVLLKAIEHAKKNDSALHLFGLVSDGGVHSELSHLFALLKMAKENNLQKVFLHAFLDGRDVSPKSAMRYLEAVENEMSRLKIGKIATVSGRFYAMDRDKRWNRVQVAYDAITGKGNLKARSASEAIDNAHARGETDEFVKPTMIIGDGKIECEHKPIAPIRNDDSVIFFNFRGDRAREITRAFTERNFKEFTSEKIRPFFVSMTSYEKSFRIPFAFSPQFPKNILPEIISRKGIKQLHAAETEKYAHVTYFFNGGREQPFHGEERILVPSPKVATYDLKPEMSAFEITEEVLKKIACRKFGFIVLNLANADMVGHTGKIDATIKAVEAVDQCLELLISAVSSVNGTLLIIGDHGNADMKVNKDGSPNTAHSLSPVPCILFSNDEKLKKAKLKNGALRDVAPTILKLMGIRKPKEMTGKSLL